MPAHKSPRTMPPTPPKDAGRIDESIPKITVKSTKQDILDAYKQLQLRHEGEEKDKPKVKVEAERKRREKVVESAKTASVEGIIESIGAQKLDVTDLLNSLSGKLTAQVQRLAEIEEAITIESERLSGLHDIEIAADTLSMLLERHKEAEVDFDKRIEEKRQEVQENLASARAEYESWTAATKEEFEAGIEEKQAEWKREQASHDEQVKERNDKAKKEREREQEEYAYLLKLNRKRDEDIYKAKKEWLEKDLAATREAQEQELAQREKAVGAREEELSSLREQVESFPKQLDKAIAEARLAARKEAEKEAKVTRDLREKEISGEKQVADLRIETLTNKVEELEARIKELNRQVEGATTKVQQISIKAIEGAEGRKALSALNEIALEQAKRPRES